MIYVNTAGENVCDGQCTGCDDRSCPDYFNSNKVQCCKCKHLNINYEPQTHWEPEYFGWNCKLDLEPAEEFNGYILCPRYEEEKGFESEDDYKDFYYGYKDGD